METKTESSCSNPDCTLELRRNIRDQSSKLPRHHEKLPGEPGILVAVQLPSCVQLFSNPMECHMPVPHHFLDFAQVHVLCICDAIQPSHLWRSLLLLPSIFPIRRSFPMSWLFSSQGHSVGASASASVLPMSIQG